MRPGARLSTAAALVAVAAGCGGTARPHFRSAKGWHLLASGGELAAANVDFAAHDLASHPDRTVATLPRDGIVIWATVSRANGEPAGRSTPVPLRLSQATRSPPFEGFRCAPAVSTRRCHAAAGSVRRLGAQVGRYAVDLYVFFGTDRPTAASLAAANAELARLHFPHLRAAVSAAPVCPARSGRGAYDTTLSPSHGPAGSTATLSGPLPVLEENGAYGGQTATHVDAYWNLDFAKWWTALTVSPIASVTGSPVRRLGRQDVAKRCRYRLQVRIPTVPPGTYPIEVLFGDSKGTASFGPVRFRLTAG